MKPLSSWNYFISNKKKVLPVIISIAIGVFLLYFMYIIGDSVINTASAGYLDTFSYFSIIHPTEEEGIPQEIRAEISSNENVEKMINIGGASTNINFLGSYTSTMVLYLPEEDLSWLFDKMQLKLKHGRLPKNKNEILMHWRIAANKGYKLNDTIGTDVSDKEQLAGKYTITGIYDGPSILCLIPVSRGESSKFSSVMAVSKTNKINELNAFIYKLPRDKIDISSLVKMKNDFKGNMSIVYIGSSFIELLIILVLCITIGNTTYLHYYQRKREFGILIAVGYKKKDILKRIYNEIIYMIALAFISGIILAIAVGYVLKAVYMNPTGSIMNLFKPQYILITAAMPISVFIFSLLPSSRMIMRVDKLEIIEG